MSDAPENRPLHLPDLSIKAFRGIADLSIPRLGRVTLITGRNGVGKTTVLEAVRIYAARGRYGAWSDLLGGREEFSQPSDDVEEGLLSVSPLSVSPFEWSALFFGRDPSGTPGISIGPANDLAETVRLETQPLGEELEPLPVRLPPELLSSGRNLGLKVLFRNSEHILPLLLHIDEESHYYNIRKRSPDMWPAGIRCEALGPGLLTNVEMARYWDKVALTDDEDRAVKAVNMVLGNGVERIAMVGGDGRRPSPPPMYRRSRYPGNHRRVIVKLNGHAHRVPLTSLGDGAVRSFAVALTLANSRNGFLVIDEAENGIHHSVQSNFWRMILRTACANNMQVLATTHSWDCVRGFARATEDLDAAEGILIRLEKDGESVRAVQYSRGALRAAAEHGIEVR